MKLTTAQRRALEYLNDKMDAVSDSDWTNRNTTRWLLEKGLIQSIRITAQWSSYRITAAGRAALEEA